MIPLASPKDTVDAATIEAAVGVMKSGRYILGEQVERFEREFSFFAGTKRAVAVTSGTTALHLALLSCGIGKGDEVVTTPFTFIATSNSVLYTGATPVFSDVSDDTLTIDPEKIKAAITKKTKAIMPVHLYGHPADMKPIMELAEMHSLKVIGDACQAHGAEYAGKKIGTFGNVSCYSFFPSKIMTVCGDGGMLVTDDDAIADAAMILRNQGRRPSEKYTHHMVGYNYRMSEMSAAIGRAQLRMVPEWVEKRRQTASLYNKLLEGNEKVRTPAESPHAKASYYVYTVRTDEREKLSSFLKEKGVSTGIYYPVPMHRQPCYSGLPDSKKSFPVSEKAASEVLSLPMFQTLKESQVREVAQAVNSYAKASGS